MNVRALFGAAVSLCISAAAASASTVSVNTWYEFGFGGTDSALISGNGFIPGTNPVPTVAPDAPWEFTLASAGTLFVTDMFNSGDQFELFNDGISLGLTSNPVEGSNCGSDLTCAILNTNLSSGSFALAAGTYSITGLVRLSPFGGGAGAFIISTTPVPIPAALPLLASGLGALGFAGWRRNKKNKLAA
jgi:hypothetical protein